MASGITGPAGPLMATLFEAGSAAGLADRALLDRFLAGGAGAEAAFAALVERHGPAVLRVCRDVLGDTHDADDAFQAAFLVLARRAGSIRSRESIGGWLYGVALRVARCARRKAGRRRAVEREGAAMRVEAHPPEPDRLDAAPVLHDEIGRLPEGHRAAVVLCYFEGLTHDQAAGRLGWPVGTVRSRLAWARDRLRSRLARRGLAPSAGFLAATAAGSSSSATVPASLAASTVGLVMRAAEAGAVPASVAALASRALRVTAMTKLKWITSGLVAAGLVASAGVGLVAGGQEPKRADAPQKSAAEKPGPAAVVDPVAPPPEAPRPRAAETRREPAPPAVSPLDPPRVLFARLKTASAAARKARHLIEQGAAPLSDAQAPQGEVDALLALLESRRDDLRDQVRLLQAQQAICEADVAVAEAQVRRATLPRDQTKRMADQLAVSRDELAISDQEVAIRTAERVKKQAEVFEVQVRIEQAGRQLRLVEGLLAEANALVADLGPVGALQGPPAPPAAPLSPVGAVQGLPAPPATPR